MNLVGKILSYFFTIFMAFFPIKKVLTKKSYFKDQKVHIFVDDSNSMSSPKRKTTLDNIFVEAYGSKTLLNQSGSVRAAIKKHTNG